VGSSCTFSRESTTIIVLKYRDSNLQGKKHKIAIGKREDQKKLGDDVNNQKVRRGEALKGGNGKINFQPLSSNSSHSSFGPGDGGKRNDKGGIGPWTVLRNKKVGFA